MVYLAAGLGGWVAKTLSYNDELGMLMISVTVISLVLPIFTVLICNRIFQLSNRKCEIIPQIAEKQNI